MHVIGETKSEKKVCQKTRQSILGIGITRNSSEEPPPLQLSLVTNRGTCILWILQTLKRSIPAMYVPFDIDM